MSSQSRSVDLAEGLPADAYYCERPTQPCAIVLFGASGDLARRKIFPALFDLASHNCLAPSFRLLGFARSPMTDDAFRESSSEFLPRPGADSAANDSFRNEFVQRLHYLTGQYDDPASYQNLAARLEELDREGQLGGNRLFYLSVPPEIYAPVIEQLGKANLAKPRDEKSWTRIIIEKPFGRDAKSARELNQRVRNVFEESQIYRIDHYLGKETVQNVLAFRFSNGIFEPIWNRNYVDHIQITAAETLGVERRAAFYETAGALRDMVQSHVLQLTSLVSLEPPSAFEATAVRNEKIKVLQSIRPFTRDTIWRDVVRGQYGPGTIDGKAVPGYRQEPGVKPDSRTETYVAMKLSVDNWRWHGVPFYLRTGKRLSRSLTEIAIQFRQAPHLVFQGEQLHANLLVINIQPDEGISLSFGAKSPGAQMHIRPVTMDFSYRTTFGGKPGSAYATLINDCIRGDATLFDRADSVEAAWDLVDPILQAWSTSAPPPFPNYASGTSGPRAAGELTTAEDHRWRNL
ncbi:MAG: glucose-6-phosphate dehydrogenase [Candidatus Acidiferrales bacterium]